VKPYDGAYVVQTRLARGLGFALLVFGVLMFLGVV
jgi:hypothetical protein